MNISRIFIERPIATSVLFVGIMFFGWLGFNTLPVNDLPNVDFPTINVTARLPGASPEVMGNSVALPLEREFSRTTRDLQPLLPDSPVARRLRTHGRKRTIAQWQQRARVAAGVTVASLIGLIWKLNSLEGYPLIALSGIVLVGVTYFVWCRLVAQSLPPDRVQAE